MQFSDTTNKNGLIQRCEILLGFSDGGISGNSTLLKQFTGLINSSYHKVVTMILDAQDEWDWDDINQSDYPIYTFPLVANQRDYNFAATYKFLKIKRLDITYDGVTYYKAEPFDINESSDGFGPAANTTMETTVDGRFDKTRPRYDMRANGIFLYPRASAADVTAGAAGRVEFFREPVEFTSSSTTAEPGIDEPFHPMIAIDTAYNFTIALDPNARTSTRAQMLKNELNDFEIRLRKYYGRKQDDRSYQLKSGFINYN